MALLMRRSRLPFWFKKRNKTQQQLAEYLGVTQSYISQVANNKEVFSLEMSFNAAEFFKCTVEDLVELEYVPGPYIPPTKRDRCE